MNPEVKLKVFQRMFIDCCCEQTSFGLKEFSNKRIDVGGYQINKLNCPELDGGIRRLFFNNYYQILSNVTHTALKMGAFQDDHKDH